VSRVALPLRDAHLEADGGVVSLAEVGMKLGAVGLEVFSPGEACFEFGRKMTSV